jgi:hypothetical protein
MTIMVFGFSDVVGLKDSIFPPNTHSLRDIRFLQNDKGLGEQYSYL